MRKLIIFLILLIPSISYAQYYDPTCKDGTCPRTFSNEQVNQNGQVNPNELRDYTYKQICNCKTRFEQLDTHINNINKSIGDINSAIEDLKNSTNNQSILDRLSSVELQLGDLKQVDSTIRKSFSDVEKSTKSTVTGYGNQIIDYNKKINSYDQKINSYDQQVNALILRNKGLEQEQSKLRSAIEIAKKGWEAKSYWDIFKYATIGSTGFSSIALFLAIYAIKKRAVPKVKEIIKERYIDSRNPHTEHVTTHDNQSEADVIHIRPHGPKTRVVVQESPPAEQIYDPKMVYAPYDVDTHRRHYEQACKEAVKRYPGQDDVLRYVDSLIEQFRNAERKQ